uniref:Ribosomal protein L33 n=1 Tax=Romanomermis culicivorax TaxID=13658 RepID=A0A915IIF6_ROMCU
MKTPVKTTKKSLTANAAKNVSSFKRLEGEAQFRISQELECYWYTISIHLNETKRKPKKHVQFDKKVLRSGEPYSMEKL